MAALWIAMRRDWVASLPMYDFPELQDAHDAFWTALASRLVAAGLTDAPRALTRGATPAQVWGSPRLLFAQGCEYPLAKAFGDRVRVVAHPMYSAAGCDGSRYRSAIVVRKNDTDQGASVGTADVVHGVECATGGTGAAESDAAVTDVAVAGADAPAAFGSSSGHFGVREVGGVDTDTVGLAGLRGRRCVVNERDSNSGMNLLRATIAQVANGEPFFASVAVSGSHLRSVEMVASGEADVAAIDCVSFAHFQRLYPSLFASMRVLSWTASTPSLPYITAGTASDETMQVLRAALADVFDDNGLAPVRERLQLRGVDLSSNEGFGEVLHLERAAVSSGYPILR
jgi:ABC-type phosphate/phosphonate transport system substrate-binding protein